jgi:hypothetical protein
LGISVDGHTPLQNQCSLRHAAEGQADPEDEDTESASPDDQSRGIPDAWIYTRQSNILCVLIEIKTRGAIDPGQIQRHEHTHFGQHGATLRKINLTWKKVSRAIYRAYHDYPNNITDEFLSFLSREGLAATFRFDDTTIHLARGKLPTDVTEDLARRLRRELHLDSEQLIIWPDWPHVMIFRNFEAVGNIEIWLSGEPPDVNVQTSISVGTVTPRHNLLSMPDQIERLLEKLARSDVQTQCANAINAVGHQLSWTVLDRLQRIQLSNWESRNSAEIIRLLRAAGHDPEPAIAVYFGIDHPIPGNDLERVAHGLRSLHRKGQILGGDFNGYRIFARAYLEELRVPAYGRAPQDVLPQVVEHCIHWYRILRALSGIV